MCHDLAEISELKDGFNAIGFSQVSRHSNGRVAERRFWVECASKDFLHGLCIMWDYRAGNF